MRPALQIRGLAKTYHSGPRGHTSAVEALSGIDVEAERGEIVGIAGAAGAGKSTLMLCAAGLLRADHGCVSWFGETISGHHVPPGIAYVPRRAGYYSFLTVCEALEYHATLHELASSDRAAQVDAAMGETSLVTHAKRRVSQLSPALLQRLGLAQALIGNPRAILLDQTLSGEGLLSRHDVVAVLRKISRGGVTVLLSARDAGELEPVASRVYVLSRGHIIDAFARSAETTAERQFAWPETVPQLVAESRERAKAH